MGETFYYRGHRVYQRMRVVDTLGRGPTTA